MKPPDHDPNTHCAFDPEKAHAWGEQWRLKHAGRWTTHGDSVGLFPIGGLTLEHAPKAARCLAIAHPRAGIILALERQINGGAQLSEQGAPVLGLK